MRKLTSIVFVISLVVVVICPKASARIGPPPPEVVFELYKIEPTEENLRQALHHEAWDVRWAAAKVLAEKKGKEVIPDLRTLLKQEKELSRQAEIGYILAGLEDPTGIDVLKTSCDQVKDNYLRVRAATYLANLGDGYGYQAVTQILREEKASGVLVAALEALGGFKKFEGLEVVSYLLKGLKSPEKNVRIAASSELADLGDRSLLPALQQALEREKDPDARSSIESAIRCLLGPVHPCPRVIM